MTTTFNLGQYNATGFLGRRVQTWGQPLVLPTDTEADGADNVELEEGALLLCITLFAGNDLYVKTGLAGATALTVGNGWRLMSRMAYPVQVGVEADGTRHTHLYYINSDA